MSIWNWMQQNAEVLTGLGNWLLVFIWAIYLQMFYRQYRRQQMPELVIHHAQGFDSAASCLLVNMSKEAVHVQCVLARTETEQETRIHQVMDYRRVSAEDSNPEWRLRQGPLKSGDYLLLGRFENIISGRESRPRQTQQEAPIFSRQEQSCLRSRSGKSRRSVALASPISGTSTG